MLDCLYSRLSNTATLNRNEIFLDYSMHQNEAEKMRPRHGRKSNQNGQTRAKLDRNENFPISRLSNFRTTLSQNSLGNFSNTIQSINLMSKKQFSRNEMESGNAKKKIIRIEDKKRTDDRERGKNEQVTETTFHRTCKIRSGALDKSVSESWEKDIAIAVTWDKDEAEAKKLLSFPDLVNQNMRENPGNTLELEAATQMITSSLKFSCDHSESTSKAIIKVDLTAKDNGCSPEVRLVQQSTRVKHNSKREDRQNEQLGDVGIFSLPKLCDKNLLAELISEDVWMDRLRRVIERNDRAGFQRMGPCTNPLWNQLSVIDDCILVDKRLAVSVKLRTAVMKRIHRGRQGQEAMLDVSNYLWWPHLHKDIIINLAGECRECTRYGKNAKNTTPKNASKPLPLPSQPGHERT